MDPQIVDLGDVGKHVKGLWCPTLCQYPETGLMKVQYRIELFDWETGVT
jgi:hypothetical protein